MRITPLVSAVLLAVASPATAQETRAYTHADTLRGSLTAPERTWWDVTFYDLHVAVRPADSTIRGWNAITYRVLSDVREMQIDLQTPLEVDSMVQNGLPVPFRRDGNAFFAAVAAPQPIGREQTITVYYGGRPTVARRPPWGGGFSWVPDSLGRPWAVTSNQGIGPSIWWPNKDIGADEPDSQRVAITVPDPMVNVSNGRLRSVRPNGDGTTTYEWFATSPINNYGISVNAGGYAHYSKLYRGEEGTLTLDFWPLDYHVEAAERQWAQAESMLRCFEHWFGPYPFYEDGFKLVEVSYLGMEHQSAVAYGNRFLNGYLGRDLSGTGLGLEWDFIIVHESAHEWFANNITAMDNADMWVHESFANYAENLYTECILGREAGARYVIGTRQGIRSDRPIVPAYGVNAQGSGDMYPKGGNMLHTLRQLVEDDERWRGILRGLNRDFRHQTVTGAQIEAYLSEHTGIDLTQFFDQYLRTTQVPVLEYVIEGSTLRYRWTEVVPGFDMPVRVTLADVAYDWIRPREAWQEMPIRLTDRDTFQVDANFYVTARRVEP